MRIFLVLLAAALVASCSRISLVQVPLAHEYSDQFKRQAVVELEIITAGRWPCERHRNIDARCSALFRMILDYTALRADLRYVETQEARVAR